MYNYMLVVDMKIMSLQFTHKIANNTVVLV